MKQEILDLVGELQKTTLVNQNLEIEPCYTLVVYLGDQLAAEIESFINELKEVDPGQLYYDRAKLHLTLYGDIKKIDSVPDFEKFLAKILSDTEISFELGGVSTSAIIAAPTFDLVKFRTEIAAYLGESNPCRDLAWLTTLRLKNLPNEKFLEIIAKNQTRRFGLLKPVKLELHKTASKILHESSKEIFSIHLNG